jgi:transposase
LRRSTCGSRPGAAPKKAVIAVAASMLKTAYHMLADGTCYQDLGADYFARRDPRRVVAKLASRIRSLGYDVVVNLPEVAA